MQERISPSGDRVRQALHEFLHLDAAAGLVLMAATVVALGGQPAAPGDQA